MELYYETYIQGQTVYRCVKCMYNTFEKKNIDYHSKKSHGVLPLPEMDIPLVEWINTRSKDTLLRSKKLAIGFLTWNCSEAAYSSATAIQEEVGRLLTMGLRVPDIIWVDNGSSDDTVAVVRDCLGNTEYTQLMECTNSGQSIARNNIIESALASKVDYLLMVDGDVELIPFSSHALLRFVTEHTPYGCLGFYSPNCTHLEDGSAAKECRVIVPEMVSEQFLIAWTQYGLFDMKVFRDGVRFDTSPCFRGPGWGLEDDDLCIQMAEKGYKCANTRWFRYMHRRRHSSLKSLDRDLASKVFYQRKAYVNAKWGGKPFAKPYLEAVARENFPKLDY